MDGVSESSSAIEGISGSVAVTERLLEAAIDVFAERGFEGATVAQVARRADLTTGAIYARWPGKRELFLAAVDHITPQRMVFLISRSEMSTVEKLDALGTNLIASGSDQLRNLMLEALVSARRDPSLSEEVFRSLGAEADALASMISEGKGSGAIDTSLSTDAIVFFCQSLAIGSHLVLSGPPGTGGGPAIRDWNALIGRVIAAVAST